MSTHVPLTTLAIAASLVFVVLVVVWLARTAESDADEAPSVAEVVPTQRENERQLRLVTLQEVEGKGLGVTALVHLPAWTCLGPYPGKVYSMRAYRELKAQGAVDDEYAIEFWDARPGEKINEQFVINPMLARRSLPDKYMCAPPFVNEPGPDQGAPNLAWVWNFPRHRVELWTTRDVRVGEELTVCYGQGYARAYRSSCQGAGVEAPRLAIGSPDQKRPLDWHRVVGPGDTAPPATNMLVDAVDEEDDDWTDLGGAEDGEDGEDGGTDA